MFPLEPDVKVNVRLFAGLREVLGRGEVTLEVSEGATVGDLQGQLVGEYPAVGAFLPTLVWAVNEDYVAADHQLREGDEIALIPPISGG